MLQETHHQEFELQQEDVGQLAQLLLHQFHLKLINYYNLYLYLYMHISKPKYLYIIIINKNIKIKHLRFSE